MGDQNTPLLAADARHLLRRTGFGAPADQVANFTGLTRGEAADTILDFLPSGFKPRGREIDDVHNRWIKYIIGSRHPIQEKLVLFWHDHFATSYDKVQDTTQMSNQNHLLRQFCKGNFKDFVKAINKDPAMMEFLDTVRNDQDQPNENYPRELQELFTLGVKDLAGNPNYEQADIVQIARAFTGWRYDKNDAFLDQNQHDFNVDWEATRGPKVIYQTRGGFGSAGKDYTLYPPPDPMDPNPPAPEGPAEIDRVIDIIFEHKDTDGRSTVARYIAKKLLTYFANPTPSTADIDQVISDANFDGTNPDPQNPLKVAWNIAQLVRAILVNDVFYQTAAVPPYTSATKKSVKWPVDYVASTLRLLKMKLKGSDQQINYSSFTPIRDYLTDMGQVLLQPPSVFGWEWENGWVSSATLLARYSFVTDLTRARGRGTTSFRPEKLDAIKALMGGGLTPADVLVDTVTDILGVKDQLTAAERTALITYVGGPIDLNDLEDHTRNVKLNGLFALVLESPAYQLH